MTLCLCGYPCTNRLSIWKKVDAISFFPAVIISFLDFCMFAHSFVQQVAKETDNTKSSYLNIHKISFSCYKKKMVSLKSC
jgi:hypothetical protein